MTRPTSGHARMSNGQYTHLDAFMVAASIVVVALCLLTWLFPYDGSFYVNVARIRLADGTERNMAPAEILRICRDQSCWVSVFYD